MMEDLPLDTNHPAVRDYLALIRHVSGCSPRKEYTGLIRPSPTVDYSGMQVAGLDAAQSASKHNSGASMQYCCHPWDSYVECLIIC